MTSSSATVPRNHPASIQMEIPTFTHNIWHKPVNCYPQLSRNDMHDNENRFCPSFPENRNTNHPNEGRATSMHFLITVNQTRIISRKGLIVSSLMLCPREISFCLNCVIGSVSCMYLSRSLLGRRPLRVSRMEPGGARVLTHRAHSSCPNHSIVGFLPSERAELTLIILISGRLMNAWNMELKFSSGIFLKGIW